MLLREHGRQFIPVTLDDEIAEDLEMMTRPELLRALAGLDKAVAQTDFDISKVRVIRSLDEVF